jgi:hypothetical protein
MRAVMTHRHAAVGQGTPAVRERPGPPSDSPARRPAPPAAAWRRLAGGRAAELALVLALLVLATLSRRLGYLFSHSFWLDEGWVADSVRAPLGQLRLLTSSTPIGWTLLLRLVPAVGAPERLRLLPLAFAVAAVVPAYLLGRRLGRVQAVAAGLAAALAPGALANDDLKQYTADVFVTLLLLSLAAWAESGWEVDPSGATASPGPRTPRSSGATASLHEPRTPRSSGATASLHEPRTPRRLLVLCAACLPAVLVSHVTVFVSAAVLAALALRCLAERRWRRLGRVVGLGLAVALLEGAVYLAFASAGDNAGMQRYWAPFFVPLSAGPGQAAAFVASRLAAALGRAGFGPWALAAALAVAGLAALWRGRLPATALAVPLLLAELVVAGAARRYPFLDERTSLFFTVLVTVCAGLGAGALLAPAFRRPLTAPIGLLGAGLAAALLLPAGRAAVRTPMPGSTLRQQVAFVLAERRPGDVVVVGRNASYAFAYYWPQRPTFARSRTGTAVLFQVEYPDRPDLVVAHARSQAEADAAIRRARARTSSGRIWLVLAEAGDGGPIWPTAAPAARRANGGRLPMLLQVPPR